MDTERSSEQERNCGLLKNKMYYPTCQQKTKKTKNMTPSHFSSTVLLLSFLSPFFLPHQFFMPLPSPRGEDQRVKEIHQCLLKSLCCLINKEGGWIRKLNHVGLLMSLPTDKHEILWVFGCFAPSLRLCHHLIIWWDVIAHVCVKKWCWNIIPYILEKAEIYFLYWNIITALDILE